MCKLSLPQQNYIETIHEICLQHNHAHTKEIALKLNVKMASVTEAINKLSNNGLVNYNQRQPITLTEKGLLIAEQLNNRHKVLEDFFNLIGCDKEEAKETACKVEHDIDDKVTKKIEILNKKIKTHLFTMTP